MSFRSPTIGRGVRIDTPTRVGSVREFYGVESLGASQAQMNPMQVSWNDLSDRPTLTNGTVTSVSVTTANGVSGSVANPSTTPAITITLGDITPTSVNASGTVGGSNLSGTNTGDVTNVDSTITVTSQVISINLSHANTWNAVQTFTDPIVGTQTFGDSTNKAASTSFVQTAINSVLANTPNKQAVDYATTAALASNTYDNGASGVGATITITANGTLTIDGHVMAVGEDLLVKNESNLKNGIYRITAAGGVSSQVVMARRTDFDTSAEITAGDTVFVRSGTSLGATTWQMITTGTITIGTTTMSWTQSAGPGSYTASNGITLTGSNFALTSISAYSYLGNTTSGSATPVENSVLTLGTPGFVAAGSTVFAQFTGTVASYRQLSIQNLSSNAAASTDFVATADNGDDSNHYINIGINSSGGGGNPFPNANAGYLYSVDNEIHIGALGSSSPTIKFYNGGGTSSPTLAGSIISGTWTIPTSAAASTNAFVFSGVTFAGTGTTSFPLILIGNGNAPTTWNTSGTYIGFNAPSGFAGDFVSMRVNGSSTVVFRVDSGGNVTGNAGATFAGAVQAGASTRIRWAGRGILTSPAADSFQVGDTDGASPTSQTIRVQSVIAGTSNTSAVNTNIIGSLSTGSGTSGSILIKVGVAPGAGSPTVQATATTAITIAGETLATTFVGAMTISKAGAASTPGLTLSGTPFGGTGTTSFPQLYLNDSTATASTTLTTAGTFIGVNSHSTSQAFADFLTDGTSKFKVDGTGAVTISIAGITTTTTLGVSLQSTVSDAVNTVRWSPRSEWIGHAWKSNATAADQTQTWWCEVVPVNGTSSTTSQLQFKYSNNGGAATTMFRLDSASGHSFSGNLILPSGTAKIIIGGGSTGFILRAPNTTNGEGCLGDIDAAAPVAQKITTQGVITGTSNTNGANFTICVSQGTGSGTGGSFIVQVSPAGGSGTTPNAFVTALTIDSTKLATFAAGITVGGNITINALSIVTDTTTGLKVGTATNQKLGFFNATPVVQQSGDISTALGNLGLCLVGTIAAASLTGGTLASGVGFSSTSFAKGTVSSGTYTPAASDGNKQHYTNNGAHTLAPPSTVTNIEVECTNGASAGTITTSGFTKVVGDALTTTNGHKFIFNISKTSSYSLLNVTALQ